MCTVLGFLEIEVLGATGSSVDVVVVVVDCVRCEHLTLDGVVVIAGAGSPGLDGAPGSSGANGAHGRDFNGDSSSRGAGGVSACLRVDSETGIDSSLMTCQYRSADGSITATPTKFDGLTEAGEVGAAGAAGVGGYWHAEGARVNPREIGRISPGSYGRAVGRQAPNERQLRALSIAPVISAESGATADSKRPTTWPSASTRNFVKFHRTAPEIPSVVSFWSAA